MSCDEAGCVVPMADSGLVTQALLQDALTGDCVPAVLIVTVK